MLYIGSGLALVMGGSIFGYAFWKGLWCFNGGDDLVRESLLIK